MKRLIYSLFTLTIMLTQVACTSNGETNSILKESKAPFGAPEFENFKIEDYKEAFDKGFAEKRADIKAVIDNTDAPTFENTIDALELSGRTLDKVSAIFFNLNESENTPEMTKIEEYVIPKWKTCRRLYMGGCGLLDSRARCSIRFRVSIHALWR